MLAVADFIVAPAVHLNFENVWTLSGVKLEKWSNHPITDVPQVSG
jgi:hypothetical protein